MDVLKNDKGSVLILFAISATMLVALLSLVLSIGSYMIALNQTQNAADSASLGGAMHLWMIQSSRPTDFPADPDFISTELVEANGCVLELVEVGHWDGYGFVPSGLIGPPDFEEDTTIEDLMSDSSFVNAVKVQATKISSSVPPLSSITATKTAVAMVRLDQDENGAYIARGSALVQ